MNRSLSVLSLLAVTTLLFAAQRPQNAVGLHDPDATAPATYDEFIHTNGNDTDIQISSNVQNNSTIPLGSKLKFDIRVRSGGYLVVINETTPTSGQPYSQVFAKARPVNAGETVRLPRNDAYTADVAGQEILKFSVFPTAEEAQAFLSRYASGRMSRPSAQAVFLQDPDAKDDADSVLFYVR